MDSPLDPPDDGRISLSPEHWDMEDAQQFANMGANKAAFDREQAEEAALLSTLDPDHENVVNFSDARKRREAGELGQVLGSTPETSVSDSRVEAVYRKKRESERKKEVMQILRLKLAGCTVDEICQTLYPEDYAADKLKARRQMSARIAEGRKKKWITSDDQDRIDNEIIPNIIEGINDLIIQGDKETLLESAKGVGIFKSHQSVRQVTAQMTELRVRIEVDQNPSGGSMEGAGANKFLEYGKPRIEGVVEGTIVGPPEKV